MTEAKDFQAWWSPELGLFLETEHFSKTHITMVNH